MMTWDWDIGNAANYLQLGCCYIRIMMLGIVIIYICLGYAGYHLGLVGLC